MGIPEPTTLAERGAPGNHAPRVEIVARMLGVGGPCLALFLSYDGDMR